MREQKEQLEMVNAIAESIQHWLRLYSCNSVDEVHTEGIKAQSCPLCMLTKKYTINPGVDCRICPILYVTGLTSCHGTPYYEVTRALTSWAVSDAYSYGYYRANFRNAALDMIYFLTKLLDKEIKKLKSEYAGERV